MHVLFFAFVEQDLIFIKLSFIICLSVLYLFFVCWISIKLLSLNGFRSFLYLLVQGIETVCIVWHLGERVSKCWDLADFCDVRWLAGGQFSLSVCFLTEARVSQVFTIRLCVIFLERRVAASQEGWRTSLFNRSGLTQQLVKLSKKHIILQLTLRLPAIEWQRSAMNLVTLINGVGLSILQCLTS